MRVKAAPIVDHEGLTPTQRKFADAFLTHCNAARAGREAGVSQAQVNRLLADGLVIGVMAKEFQRRTAESGFTVDNVLRHLAWIARGDLRTIFRPDGTLKSPLEWDDAAAACVAKIEVDVVTTQADPDDPSSKTVTVHSMKVTRWDPLRALEMLGKWHRMFSDASDAPKPPRSALPAPPGISTLDPVEASRAYRKLIEG